MTSSALLSAFEEWSVAGEPLVLATVFETEGSTYSKAGARMLITGEATFQGMLSGGCLEGDLAERARKVIDTGEPQAVTYDLGQNDEELWGLGVGCDGLMRIFLQPLFAETGYEPFRTIARALQGDTSEVSATVVESSSEQLLPGASLITMHGEVGFSDLGDEYSDAILNLVQETAANTLSRTASITTADGAATVLLSELSPPPNVLVLGAGLDAEPVVRFALELGWRVTVQDHRPAYVESGDFAGASSVLCVPVDEINEVVDLNRFDATIVMSHHLVSDRKYLEQLATTRIAYIGLLGPVDRRRRLLEELGDTGRDLESRVHGPAGLDLGGRGPAAIALSIIAEMHRHLMATAAD
jgi:xanthine/CO dehydrogenase XdhC/CoxF family maturation factor